MESSQRHLIETVAKSNPKLKRLLVQHKKFHDEIDLLEKRSFRTAKEDMYLKEIKVKKLNGLQRMLKFVDKFRESETIMAC